MKTRRMMIAVTIALATVLPSFRVGTAVGADDWPSPVAGYKAPGPGEHPRLLFRKADLPRLKKIAQTPEGQAMIKRLRAQLNGSDGESMPKTFNASANAYAGNKAVGADDAASKTVEGVSNTNPGKNGEMPLGSFTISHAAGYGFLYQLTGNKKYAELGKEAFEKSLEGVRDRDDRYSFRKPGGALRCGPSIGWHALGYDLCYDGWDPAFREKIAAAFNNYDEGKDLSIVSCAKGQRQHPGSNHWGMEVGGAAMAILAIMNDPGVDMKKIGPLLEDSEKCMIRNMTQGFGDGGFFPEGDGCGSMSSHIAFLTGLQSWKIAGGKDFISPRPNAQWMALKWVFLTIPAKSGSPSSWFWPQRGEYAHNIWARGGLSGGGYFGIGFGAIKPEQRPALLWFYNHSGLREADAAAGTPLDSLGPYPHHTVCAFVNWAWDEQEKNPGAVIPHTMRDTKWGFYAWRNRWQDSNDILISVLTKTAKGNYASKPDGALQVAAFGKRFAWGRVGGDAKYYDAKPDGSCVMTMSDGTSVAVDFSKASGADGMLVTTGAADGTKVQVGETTMTFKFLTAEKEPTPKAEGDKVVVGGQTVSFKDGNLVLAKGG